MSTYYRPEKPISLNEIKENFNFRDMYKIEVIQKDDKQYFLRNGECLHFTLDDNDNVIHLQRYADNNPSAILGSLMCEFDTRIISEHEADYRNEEVDEDVQGINKVIKIMQSNFDDRIDTELRLTEKEKSMMFWVLYEMHKIKREIIDSRESR